MNEHDALVRRPEAGNDVVEPIPPDLGPGVLPAFERKSVDVEGGSSRGRPFPQRCSEPVVLGFEGVDAFGLFGDERVGVEQLAEEIDEELAGVGEGGRGRAPSLRAVVGRKPKLIEWKKSKAAEFADEVAPDKIRFRIEKQLVRKAMGKKYG